MSMQQPVHPLDEEIDLREYLEVLLRQKWLILGLMALAVAAAAFLSYRVISPTYRSSGTFTLPPAATGGLALPVPAYETFALSDAVLRGVEERVAMGVPLDQLRKALKVRFEPDPRLVELTASAGTPSLAKRLVDAWHESLEEQLQALISEELPRRIQEAEQRVDSLREALETVGDTFSGPASEAQGGLALQLAVSSAYGQKYVDAVAERDRLRRLEAALPELSRGETLIAPAVPREPVSPRPVLNMAVAAVLAAFGGVFLAFFREWWSRLEEPVAGAEPAGSVSPQRTPG